MNTSTSAITRSFELKFCDFFGAAEIYFLVAVVVVFAPTQLKSSGVSEEVSFFYSIFSFHFLLGLFFTFSHVPAQSHGKIELSGWLYLQIKIIYKSTKGQNQVIYRGLMLLHQLVTKSYVRNNSGF